MHSHSMEKSGAARVIKKRSRILLAVISMVTASMAAAPPLPPWKIPKIPRLPTKGPPVEVTPPIVTTPPAAKPPFVTQAPDLTIQLMALDSNIAPLVSQVSKDSRIPAEVRADARDVTRAVFCKVLLDASKVKFPTDAYVVPGEEPPYTAQISLTVGSILAAKGFRVSSSAESLIATLTEAGVNQFLLKHPPDSHERMRVEQGCESTLAFAGL